MSCRIITNVGVESSLDSAFPHDGSGMPPVAAGGNLEMTKMEPRSSILDSPIGLNSKLLSVDGRLGKLLLTFVFRNGGAVAFPYGDLSSLKGIP